MLTLARHVFPFPPSAFSPFLFGVHFPLCSCSSVNLLSIYCQTQVQPPPPLTQPASAPLPLALAGLKLQAAITFRNVTQVILGSLAENLTNLQLPCDFYKFSGSDGHLLGEAVAVEAIFDVIAIDHLFQDLYGTVETNRLPSNVRDRMIQAVNSLGRRVTASDVAERALQALAADTGGFLEISDEGDVHGERVLFVHGEIVDLR